VRTIVPDQKECMLVLVCMNAAGFAIPSFYVFKGKRFHQNYRGRCDNVHATTRVDDWLFV
jgi:hypothetical protein